MEEKIYCSHCEELIDTDDYGELDGEILCSDCLDDYTTVCDCCGARIWSEDAEGDDYTSLCRQCYDYHYTRCEECDALIHNDDAYEYDDGYFCHECYQRIRKNAAIHEYSYKPTPIFYGDSNRYFGVELEIDGAGKDDDYATEILDIANMRDDHIYIKTDGSLDDGMEIVTHPMSIEYHKDFCWEDIIDYYNNERYQWSLAKLAPAEYYRFVTTGEYPIPKEVIGCSAPKPPEFIAFVSKEGDETKKDDT